MKRFPVLWVFVFLAGFACASGSRNLVTVEQNRPVEKASFYVVMDDDNESSLTIKNLIERKLSRTGFRLADRTSAKFKVRFEWKVEGPYSRTETRQVPTFTRTPDPLKGGERSVITGMKENRELTAVYLKRLSIWFEEAADGTKKEVLLIVDGSAKGITSRMDYAAPALVEEMLNAIRIQ